MAAVTYTSSMEPVTGRKFVCKRCGRVYNYPQPGDRPIRCECGWWYENIGGRIRETYWQRIEPYRTPESLTKIFS
jgi:hypothetical protein